MTIYEEIKKRFHRLSKGQRKVAQFIIDNPRTVSLHVAAEVGRQAGVSESTVIRFCYAMDLAGYTELQTMMKEYILQTEPTKSRAYGSNAKVKSIQKNASSLMNEDAKLITDTIQLIDDEQLAMAAKSVDEAQHIYVLATVATAPIAHWFIGTLEQLHPSVTLLHDSHTYAQSVQEFGPNSVLVVLALDKQATECTKLSESAQRKGVEVITIADTALSPLRTHSSYLFAMGTKQKSILNMTPVVMSFLHTLLQCTIAQNRRKYEQYQKEGVQEGKPELRLVTTFQ
ncbi:MurR/RpiR family transcriptional regulator [Caryophanon tenue]|uniref:HTH rpiR-type domain-containing protein n=1 Tax=Caryophanon tenue TaxID=33978 RepID=A0A1C0YBG6_9BACL|nr:MurR/RpiR family transcriptional regulator [Caryophanon tenue]OCS84518.1 hypothetical protein A6M13_15200 [Caryophanon tenue]